MGIFRMTSMIAAICRGPTDHSTIMMLQEKSKGLWNPAGREPYRNHHVGRSPSSQAFGDASHYGRGGLGPRGGGLDSARPTAGLKRYVCVSASGSVPVQEHK